MEQAEQVLEVVHLVLEVVLQASEETLQVLAPVLVFVEVLVVFELPLVCQTGADSEENHEMRKQGWTEICK